MGFDRFHRVRWAGGAVGFHRGAQWDRRRQRNGRSRVRAGPVRQRVLVGVVVSLGGRGNQNAILFSRASGTPLGVGRYHISDRGDGTDEILALVMT
ncbi:MAG: hypothetical protein ACREM9_07445, partial [Gemmatimonadales bacterium]